MKVIIHGRVGDLSYGQLWLGLGAMVGAWGLGWGLGVWIMSWGGGI